MVTRRSILARDLHRKQQRAEMKAAVGHARSRLKPSVLFAGWREAQMKRLSDTAEAGLTIAGRNKANIVGGLAVIAMTWGLWRWASPRLARRINRMRKDG